MSSQTGGGRIGKSLLKFLKPIRSARPHFKKWGNTQESDFKPFQFKKPAKASGTKTEEKRIPITADTTIQVPEKPPSHWLEFVTYLLSACRKTSDIMKKRIGLESYKNLLATRGKTRMKTRGSIIDVTPRASDDDPKSGSRAA